VDLLLVTVVGIIALALLFDFSNGFHDAANSVATVVATRAMPAKWAVWFSAAFNFAAYFFVGTAVANTVAKTVQSGHESIAVVFSALVAAIAWNYFTWWVGMPSSSSHAIIGGLIGAGLSAGGLHAVNWSSVEKTAIAIVASPAVALPSPSSRCSWSSPCSGRPGGTTTPSRSRRCSCCPRGRCRSGTGRTTRRRRWA
jgi:PiT family inorganic phosphate transporter